MVTASGELEDCPLLLPVALPRGTVWDSEFANDMIVWVFDAEAGKISKDMRLCDVCMADGPGFI